MKVSANEAFLFEDVKQNTTAHVHKVHVIENYILFLLICAQRQSG